MFNTTVIIVYYFGKHFLNKQQGSDEFPGF